MHPLAYLLSLRQSRMRYGPASLGMALVFGLPCLLLGELPIASLIFLASVAGLMLFLLPLYQYRCQLSLLSSLRRSHCLEELLGCGLGAQGCADHLARFAVREIYSLSLPVMIVLELALLWIGFGLELDQVNFFGWGILLWLPGVLYMTALASYLAVVWLNFFGSWRRKAGWSVTCAWLLLPGVVGLPLPLALLAELLLVRYLAGLSLGRTLSGDAPGTRPARRNRWIRAWNENPIVLRESWRRSSLPGGLPGYFTLRLASVVVPLAWAWTVLDKRDMTVYWMGFWLMGVVFFVRAASRTLGSVVKERELATWDTLAQSGLPVRTFVLGWIQVGCVPLLLQLLPAIALALMVAVLQPHVLFPVDQGVHCWYMAQWSTNGALTLALLGGLTLAALTVTGSMIGLHISSRSRNSRQASARLVGTMALGLLSWLFGWGIGYVGLSEAITLTRLIDPDGIGYLVGVWVLLPLISGLALCLLACFLAWHRIQENLSMDDHALCLRCGLGPVGWVLFLGLFMQDEYFNWQGPGVHSLMLLACLGGGWVLQWWWEPLLAARRGTLGGLSLSAALGGVLGAVVATPAVVSSWVHVQTSLTGPVVLSLLGALLGGVAAIPDLGLEAAPGGRWSRRTVAVAVLILLVLPLFQPAFYTVVHVY